MSRTPATQKNQELLKDKWAWRQQPSTLTIHEIASSTCSWTSMVSTATLLKTWSIKERVHPTGVSRPWICVLYMSIDMDKEAY